MFAALDAKLWRKSCKRSSGIPSSFLTPCHNRSMLLKGSPVSSFENMNGLLSVLTLNSAMVWSDIDEVLVHNFDGIAWRRIAAVALGGGCFSLRPTGSVIVVGQRH